MIYKFRELTDQIIGCAIEVHNELGMGFLEKVYQNALAIEFQEKGIRYRQESSLSVFYREKVVGEYIADFMIEDVVVLEIKAVSALVPAHEVQLVNYLKATGKEIGLLINFGKSVTVKRKIFNADVT